MRGGVWVAVGMGQPLSGGVAAAEWHGAQPEGIGRSSHTEIEAAATTTTAIRSSKRSGSGYGGLLPLGMGGDRKAAREYMIHQRPMRHALPEYIGVS